MNKIKEIRELTDSELTLKLADLKKELFNLRFQNSSGQLSNPKLLNTTKKDIAKVSTVIKQREIENKKKGASN